MIFDLGGPAMTVIKFPTKLPSPDQLELPRVQLIGLLQNLSGLLQARSLKLMEANNAAELAAVVRGIAGDTAEANTGWAELSEKIRVSWGI
jgi:hypothetical protein